MCLVLKGGDKMREFEIPEVISYSEEEMVKNSAIVKC